MPSFYNFRPMGHHEFHGANCFRMNWFVSFKQPFFTSGIVKQICLYPRLLKTLIYSDLFFYIMLKMLP